MIQMANDVHHQHLAWDIIDDPHGTWPPRRRWVKLDAFDYDVERAAATASPPPPPQHRRRLKQAGLKLEQR